MRLQTFVHLVWQKTCISSPLVSAGNFPGLNLVKQIVVLVKCNVM